MCVGFHLGAYDDKGVRYFSNMSLTDGDRPIKADLLSRVLVTVNFG